MPLPAPLSHQSPYVTVGFSMATCSVCRDDLGRKQSISKNALQKHLESATHLANVKGLKSLQKHSAVQKPKSARSSVRVDMAVDEPDLHFGNTPSLVPQPDAPSYTFQDFLSTLEYLTAPHDTPAANDARRPTSDDLFEDCIAHGQPTPDQHGDDDDQSELSDDHSGSDSEEEGSGFFQAPRTQYRTQPEAPSDEYFPYESLAMYLADIMFNSRRLHFSREQMRVILEFARATGGRNIPRFSALQKAQEKLKARVGDPTHRHVAPGSTVFHLNKISEMLKQDMANPHLRPHMNFLPHIEGKHMSQAWHGYKMVHDVSDGVLTPSLRVDPVTPLPSAVKMSRGFGKESASLLIQKGFGHCSSAHPSLCTAKNIQNYFVNGTVPANGTYCTPEPGWIYPTNNSTNSKRSALTPPDPYRAASQTRHLVVATSGFDSPQVEQLHPPTDKCLTPALPQSNEEVLNGEAAPDFLASQTVHRSVAVAGLLSMQTVQVQAPPAGAADALNPAAAQLKDAVLVAGAGGKEPNVNVGNLETGKPAAARASAAVEA
ncbi:unnamed protein product [Rhizoctonia solani]|uniref:Peptidase S33 tripeptidyl aminopeptidase-like C-terminal domain-containing protein n=1 Tax=Rhizoctonia solani TaxID=456999 RepID=A0A8H3HJI1_9AGAM|nr:unnamed protein product [Rhizoctonia solani]